MKVKYNSLKSALNIVRALGLGSYFDYITDIEYEESY